MTHAHGIIAHIYLNIITVYSMHSINIDIYEDNNHSIYLSNLGIMKNNYNNFNCIKLVWNIFFFFFSVSVFINAKSI